MILGLIRAAFIKTMVQLLTLVCKLSVGGLDDINGLTGRIELPRDEDAI